jgi:hypothetical protein
MEGNVEQNCGIMNHPLARALGNHRIVLTKFKECNIEFDLCDRNNLRHCKVMVAIKV